MTALVGSWISRVLYKESPEIYPLPYMDPMGTHSTHEMINCSGHKFCLHQETNNHIVHHAFTQVRGPKKINELRYLEAKNPWNHEKKHMVVSKIMVPPNHPF